MWLPMQQIPFLPFLLTPKNPCGCYSNTYHGHNFNHKNNFSMLITISIIRLNNQLKLNKISKRWVNDPHNVTHKNLEVLLNNRDEIIYTWFFLCYHSDQFLYRYKHGTKVILLKTTISDQVQSATRWWI